jgi:hypothetical protein
VVISYRRFGTTCWFLLQGSSIQKPCCNGFYDCRDKFDAFAYVSVKGTTWK